MSTLEAVHTNTETFGEIEDDAETETPKASKMKKRVKGVKKDAIITIIAESNPKRAASASFVRFEGYFTDPAPTTVQEALDNGLTMGDIHYDIIHGSISVADAIVDEYMPAFRGPRTPKSDEDVIAEVDSDSEEADLF